MATRVCTVCKRTLESKSFNKCSRNKCGLKSECRECSSTREKRWRTKNRQSNLGQDPGKRGRCCKCKLVLPASAFTLDVNRPNSLSPYCRKCRQVMARLKYTSTHGQLLMRVSAAKQRAIKARVPFSIDTEFVLSLWNKQHGLCAVSGLPMRADDTPKKGSSRSPYRPSLDRINPQKGYVPGNVRLVLTLVNVALCDWGEKAFRQVCIAIARNLK